jgi:hypothetical protein
MCINGGAIQSIIQVESSFVIANKIVCPIWLEAVCAIEAKSPCLCTRANSISLHRSQPCYCWTCFEGFVLKHIAQAKYSTKLMAKQSVSAENLAKRCFGDALMTFSTNAKSRIERGQRHRLLPGCSPRHGLMVT